MYVFALPLLLLMIAWPAGRAAAKTVSVIPVSGDVDPGMAAFIERALADTASSDILIFEMDTFGGRVDSALKIVDLIADVSDRKTIAYVSKKAISAGALIALACHELVMKQNTTIGDCAPISFSQEGPKMMGEKFQSPLRAKFRALAKRNQYPGVLAESMVTPEMEVFEIQTAEKREFIDAVDYRDLTETQKKKILSKKTVVKKGELLTMDDVEAVQLGFSRMSVSDLDALLELLPTISTDTATAAVPPEKKQAVVRIALARDAAFCFYYPENIEMLEQAGAQIVYFSPLSDPGLPDKIDGLYLGGGYPELHARTLTQNTGFRQAVSLACKNGMPIYAECGGFMTLCRTLEDLDGQCHDMVGCFEFTCRMSKRLRALGYREITLNRNTILGQTGVTARGHEFHYSSLDDHGEKSVYNASDRTGDTRAVPGFEKNRTLGSYLHLHFKSNPDVPHNFVQACFQYQEERKSFRK